MSAPIHTRRVLIVASTFPRWDGDTMPPFIRLLADALVAQGCSVDVLAPHDRGALRHEQHGALGIYRFRYAPARFETLAYGGGMLGNLRENPVRWLLVPGYLLALALALLTLTRRRRYDVIHSHWVVPQGLVTAALRRFLRLPLVLSAHGGDVFASRAGWRRLLARFALRGHDTLSVNSSAMGAAVGALTGRSVSVVPMGVDIDHFMRADGAADNDEEVLFVGRLDRKKGVEYLLDAMPAIIAARPAARLRIVGDGLERERLEQQARALSCADRVRFDGAVAHTALLERYRAASVFVAPSVITEDGDTEALGVVLLEAAACSLPIVASDVGGIGDIVRDGETGVLVPERSAAAISDAVVALLTAPERAARLGQRAREHVVAHYSWRSVAARFAQLYSQTIENSDVARTGDHTG